MIHIGLFGYKQIGKSTAAKYLENYGFARHNMKDALVKEIREGFPDLLLEIAIDTYGLDVTIDEDKYIDKLFQDKPALVRTLLQNFGTEIRRSANTNYWIDKWTANMPDQNCVVDDVRFLNEAQAVRDQGGVVIHLTRPDVTTGGSHASETEQNDIEADYTICVEKGDIEGLHKEIDRIITNMTTSSPGSTWSEGLNMDSRE